jgi:hypothetical protein
MTARILASLVAAIIVAAVNWFVAVELAGGPPACVPCLAWLVLGPLVPALVAGLLFMRAAPAPAAARPAAQEPSARDTEGQALRLLATLQEEGRLVDFLEEDVAPYSDEQIGAAVRGIHDSCRRALHACVTLEPVLRGAEGEPTTVPPGFDPAAVRLVGNVSGTPPFTGVLRHPGWRVTGVNLPARTGLDDHVIAPAEVEIG